MQYIVYIIQSEVTKRYYVGQTGDLERRMFQHNSGQNKSTKHGVPWRLRYAKSFLTHNEAMSCELQVKNRGAARYLRDMAQPG